MAGFDFYTDLIPSDSYDPETYENLMLSFKHGLWNDNNATKKETKRYLEGLAKELTGDFYFSDGY